MTPEVSVVVPTCDRVDTLRQTLRSILVQPVDIEVIVVDEGSTDGTAEWLASTGDPRVRVIRHDPRRGLPAARNAGVRAATGRWVAFCDDDDVWAPTKLERQLAAADACPSARWVVAGAVLVDPTFAIIGHQPVPADGMLLDRLLGTNVVPGGGSATMVARDALVDLGGFDEGLRASEDWELWIRLADDGPAAVADGPLVGYRIWTGSMSTDEDRMRTSHREVRARHAALLRRRGVVPDDVIYERFIARQHANAGARLAAARCFLQSGRHGREILDPGRAVLAVVAPGVLVRRGRRRALSLVPPEWRAEAEPWLAGLASPEEVAVEMAAS